MPDTPPQKLPNKILSLWLLFLGWAWILMLGSGCLLLIFFLAGTLMGGMSSPVYAALFGVLMLVFLSAAVALVVRKLRHRKQEGEK